MKIVLFLVLCAVAYTVADPVGTCPEDDPATPVYFADTEYCFVFYECSNGYPIEIKCPAGTNFDPQYEVCDTQVKCGDRTTTPKVKPTTPSKEN